MVAGDVTGRTVELLSPTIDQGEFGRRFHGRDERIDVESLRLTTELWHLLVTDLLG